MASSDLWRRPFLGPNGTTPRAGAHWRSEQRIERSQLEFSVLRPSFCMETLLDTVVATGILASPFGNAPITTVDIRDVAAAATAALLATKPPRAHGISGYSSRPHGQRRPRVRLVVLTPGASSGLGLATLKPNPETAQPRSARPS